MGGINDYSQTAASNTSVGGVSTAEGMNPGLVNNAMRAQMADVAKWRDDIGGSITSGGSANAQTVTTNGVVASLADGVMVSFVAGFANTSSATLNVDGTGAKAIRKKDDQALIGGEILAGGHYVVQYDASANSSAGAWILISHEIVDLRLDDGTSATPSLSFSSDTDCGIFRAAADTIGFSGVLAMDNGSVTAPVLTFLSDTNLGLYRLDENVLGFSSGGGYVARLSANGFIAGSVGEDSPGVANTSLGSAIRDDGRVLASYPDNWAASFNRNNDGTIVVFRTSGSIQGSVSISGTTTTYNSFCGAHWSQLADKSTPDILPGTIVDAIDEKCAWPEKENDQLARFKVSTEECSSNVYGVFMHWENETAYIASLGAYIVRIAPGESVSSGDAIVHKGNGCGRAATDDDFSGPLSAFKKIVAKVTCTEHTMDFPDGSYCVPCTLHCG